MTDRLPPHQDLMLQLRAIGLEATAEVRAIPERRWRFDVGLPAENPWLLVEVHGGVWRSGRHTTGKGFTNDREKINTAVSRGFVVLECTTDQVQSGQARQWIVDTLAQRRAA